VSRVTIMLAEQDVTAYVVTEDFPEWVETSVKGPGFFDWQVQPFTFRLHESCPVVPTYGQACRVQIDGVERFTGVVDGIKDAFSKVPELTIQPPAVTLKDVLAGTPGVDPATNEERYLFEIPMPGLGIQDAIESVLVRYEANKDDRVASVDSWQVEVLGDETDFLGIRAPHGLTGPSAGSAPADTFYADTRWRMRFPFQATDEAGVTYWHDGVKRLVLSAGYPSWPVGTLRVYRRIVDGVLFIAEWVPVVVNLTATTMALDSTQTWRVAQLSPEGEADNTAPWSGYLSGHSTAMYIPAGYEVAQNLSPSIDGLTAVHYLRYMLSVDEAEILGLVASEDTDDGTWTVVYRQVPIAAPHNVEARFYVTWWGNPVQQTVSGRWKNVSMIDLIKLFAMVSGRWLKVEGNALTLTPRLSGLGEVLLPDLGQALESDQQSEFSSPSGEVRVEIIDRDDPQSTGLDYTAGQVAALTYIYVDLFAGVSVETDATWPASLMPAGLELLSDTTYGQVVELDWSVDGQRIRVKCVQEGQ